MLIDYHLHNRFSPDSEEETENICKQALSLGINEICITNHVEWFHKGGGCENFSIKEAVPRFIKVKEDIDNAQKKFSDLSIKFGVELQYMEGLMDEMKEFVHQMDFDFRIGSVHIVDGITISSGSNQALSEPLYSKNTEEYSYGRYFDLLHEMVEWGEFEIIGHFDIFKRSSSNFYDRFNPQKYKEKIIPILELAGKKGIGLELNTSGLRGPYGEIFPHPDILRWALKSGVEHFTISSDAHRAEEVGTNLDKAILLAKEVGITQFSTYNKKQSDQFNISDF